MKLPNLWWGLVPFVSVSRVCGRVTEYELLPYDSVADAAAVVVTPDKKARFTVLTPQLIRMEYNEQGSGEFEDRATLAMVNRKLPVPKFSHSINANNQLLISTDKVTLTYAIGKEFGPDTLVAGFDTGAASTKGAQLATWKYGDRNDGNLLGTIKSLDELGPISLNCTENNSTQIHDETLHCEWGVVSRSGWSIYDDSQNYCLGDGDWWDGESAAAANKDTLDLYGFFHGQDYKGAIADLTQVGGKTAMVSRGAAAGIWWTRWFNFNDMDARDIIHEYRSRSFPLDVFVLDMDWHRKNSWTGYSFDNSLFPDEAMFMAAVHDDGLQLAANLHDDVGIGPWENNYTYMANLMGTPNGTNVPFTVCTNTTYTKALEDVVLGSLESGRIGGVLAEGGMDFWWIDWQQGGNHGGCAGLKQNPTIWLNKIRCTDAKRRALAAAAAAGVDASDVDVGRNMVLARWGGMGSHRYQVGFSGDVKDLTWENLAYQPYFTLTAANVAYSFWSHDIEQPAADYELGVRWIQWAAVSPIFRSHERGMSGGSCADQLEAGQARSSCAIVKPWNVPLQYETANRAAMRRRVQLTPYIYNAARQAFDTGVGLVRPMYYEHPSEELAYGANAGGNFSQFYFGNDMIAAPVVSQSAKGSAPMSFATGMTTKSVWIPDGQWVEESTSVVHTGPAVLTKAYDVSETPVFVRAGAVIPTIRLTDGDTLGVAGRDYSALEFAIYPGATSGNTTVYEDDGATTAYSHGSYSFMDASYSISGSSLRFNVKQPESSANYLATETRTVSLRVKSAFMPTSVTIDGAASQHSRSNLAGSGTWHYCPIEMAVVVNAKPQSASLPLSIVVTTSGDFAEHSAALNGLKGHIAHANLAKQSLDLTRKTVGAHDPSADYLKTLSSTGTALSYLTAKPDGSKAFAAKVAGVPQLIKDALTETSSLAPFKENPARLQYALDLLNSVVSA